MVARSVLKVLDIAVPFIFLSYILGDYWLTYGNFVVVMYICMYV
jgi:hypothetical protein